MFHEVASGAKTDRAQLRRVINQLDADAVLRFCAVAALAGVCLMRSAEKSS